MGMISSAEMRKKIANMYDNDPEGWQVFAARGRGRYYDTVFIHGDDHYIIKEEVINPYESIGLATHEKIESKKSSLGRIPFGLRGVPSDMLKRMMNTSEESGRDIISEVLTQRPFHSQT